MTSENTSARPRERMLVGLPIFWQVLSLSLIVLITSLLINTLIVIKAPSPQPSGYTIAEATQAFKIGEVKLRNGRKLKTEILKTAPDFIKAVSGAPKPGTPRQFERPFEELLKLRLSQSLGVPASDIYVEDFRDPFRDRYRRRFERATPPPRFTPGQGNGDGPPDLILQTDPSGGQYPAPPHIAEAQRVNEALPPSLNRQITFPPFRAAWKLSDGTYRVLVPPKRFIEPWQAYLLLGFLITAVLITPLAFIMSRRLTRPIRALADGAGQMGFDTEAAPLKTQGPAEVRAAVQVLNAMQVRIKKHVESRTALIAAIAHDLKTPLARLRLRIETLPAKDKDKIAQDISHMDSLINSALNFASADRMAQNVTPLDLSSLIEIICEDMTDVHAVTCEDITSGLTVMGNDIAIRRIVTNLIENAARYAGGCVLYLNKQDNAAELIVRDQGPGMPPEALEAVFEPFYRLESSRNRDTGGAGLGLSVARTMAEAMGGTLVLKNRYDGGILSGLDAILTLPLKG